VVVWLAASPWYQTAKCQPSSPCGNGKGKSSGLYASCLLQICCNLPPRWCKIMSHSAPILSSKMAATSLHVGQLFVRKSTPRASWVASWAFRTSWFLINLVYWFFSLLPSHCSDWAIPVLVYRIDVFMITVTAHSLFLSVVFHSTWLVTSFRTFLVPSLDYYINKTEVCDAYEPVMSFFMSLSKCDIQYNILGIYNTICF
jgi:hypothetical protein